MFSEGSPDFMMNAASLEMNETEKVKR